MTACLSGLADLSSASAVVSDSIKQPRMKRLSTSTSQLSKKKLSLPDGMLQKHALVGCSIGNITEDSSSGKTSVLCWFEYHILQY